MITTIALLIELDKSPNEAVWAELDARYRPILMGVAYRLGLTNADAEDVVQEVLTRFVSSYRAGEYDPGRGRLRPWIVRVAHNAVMDFHRANAVRRTKRGESALVNFSSADEFARVWDEQYRATIIQRAMSELRSATRIDPKTVTAFEEVGVRGRPAEDVAVELSMSIGSVYAAKSRCVKELREIMDRLNIQYDE